MYELWITADGYIEGKKLGRASSSLQTIKTRARKHFPFAVMFDNDLKTEETCIWIDAADSKNPVGLIKKV